MLGKSVVLVSIASTAALALPACTKINRKQIEPAAATQQTTAGVNVGTGGTGGAGSALSAVTCAISTAIPTYWRNNAQETFAFNCSHQTGKQIISTECSLDDGAWSACAPAGKTVSALSEGAHRFRVRGTADDGTSGMSGYALWGTDLTPPSIDLADLFSMNKNAPTLQFSASDPGAGSGFSGYQCRLTPGFPNWETCTPPRTYPSLAANQPFAFQVRAKDQAGNWSGPTSVNFNTVTLVASGSCSITSNVPPYSRLKTQALTYVCSSPDEPIATVECRLDSGAFAPCQAPTAHTLTNLTDGNHKFEVRYVTTLGNASPAQAASWIVDTIPPVAAITNAATGNLMPGFTFSVTDPGGLGVASALCKLGKSTDQGILPVVDWAPCVSPKTYTTGINPEQQYYFYVKGIDLAGNEGTAAEHVFDGNPGVGPACVTTTNFAGGYSNNPSPTIAYTCSAQVSFSVTECSVDGGPFAACNGNGQHTLSGLTGGTHSFRVRATDRYGNVGSPSATLAWTLDTVAPAVTIISTEIDTPTARLTFTATDSGSAVERIECQLDAGMWVPCSTGQVVYSSQTIGTSYTGRVRAKDLAGNVSPVDSKTWTSQPAEPAPTCVATAPAVNGYTAQTSRTFNFSCTNVTNGANVQCSQNGVAWAACNQPFVFNTPNTGHYCIFVRGLDTYGRAGGVDQTCWDVDRDKPTSNVTNVTLHDEGNSNDSISAFFASTDVGGSGVSKHECRYRQLAPNPTVDTGWVTCTSPYVKKGLKTGNKPGGSYRVDVRATDSAGNLGNAAQRSWQTGDLSSGGGGFGGPIPQATHTGPPIYGPGTIQVQPIGQ